jgi:aldose 1-epimerase
LRSMPAVALHSVRDSGCYPLVPFSNRIGSGALEWHGTRHQLPPNFPPEPHAIHGVGWRQPWTVLQAQAQSALLGLSHGGDQHWPFAFDCTQAFELHPGALEVTFSVTNRAAHEVPMGLGWHPYFVKRAQSHLRFSATGRWDMGRDKLPTQHQPLPGLDAACTELDVDHCFDGWDGVVHLDDGMLSIRLSSSLSRLVVFTNRQRDFVAIEPVSHVNNALQLAARLNLGIDTLGVRVLRPGESMVARMEIAVRQADQAP